MIRILLARLRQGHRTTAYPDGPAPPLPERFRGRPVIAAETCPDGCGACAEVCPTEAITISPVPSAGRSGEGPASERVRIDLGRCLFCPECQAACPAGAIAYTREHRLAARRREELVVGPGDWRADAAALRAEALGRELRRLLGRSLKLREVSAGGCNACEADVNVLSTIGWDIGRFGIQIVASPRHADGLLITGPVTENMREALRKTYDAVPDPKIVIAVGACAISGGPYAGHPEQHDGAASVVPVDLFIPGCPSHPLTILDGLLRLLGRVE